MQKIKVTGAMTLYDYLPSSLLSFFLAAFAAFFSFGVSSASFLVLFLLSCPLLMILFTCCNVMNRRPVKINLGAGLPPETINANSQISTQQRLVWFYKGSIDRNF